MSDGERPTPDSRPLAGEVSAEEARSASSPTSRSSNPRPPGGDATVRMGADYPLGVVVGPLEPPGSAPPHASPEAYRDQIPTAKGVAFSPGVPRSAPAPRMVATNEPAVLLRTSLVDDSEVLGSDFVDVFVPAPSKRPASRSITPASGGPSRPAGYRPAPLFAMEDNEKTELRARPFLVRSSSPAPESNSMKWVLLFLVAALVAAVGALVVVLLRR